MARIVVVEDDADILRLLELRLTRAGHEVTCAGDGVEGLEAAQREHPDAIVLDWMMPRMSGLDLCRELRGDPALSTTPVLMLTAKTQPLDMERALASGADDYLMKPFVSAEFLARVDALLARGRDADPLRN
ncbi:MAG: response regulator [Actinomycetales bacterium]|nr:response regulator [Actinomycetales bacterium]